MNLFGMFPVLRFSFGDPAARKATFLFAVEPFSRYSLFWME